MCLISMPRLIKTYHFCPVGDSVSMAVVPDSLCANALCFRSLPGRGEDGLLGCGIMRKVSGWDGGAREAYSAVLCLRGRGWYQAVDGPRIDLVPGMLFQRFTGVDHRLWIEPGERWSECWVQLGRPVEETLAALGVLDRATPVRHPGIDLALIRELRRAVEALAGAAERELPQHLVRLQGLLLSLLGSGLPAADGFDTERACRLLADAPRADLNAVARELGLGYGAFRKAFRAAVGVAPGEYRLRRRLERARTELLAGGRTVADIAHRLGWANPFTFTALFRKHVGMSPRAWQRRQRG